MAEEMITATIVIPADQLMALLKRQMPEDRHEQMVRLYGEACRQCKAAKILGVSAQTIMRMREDGRLRATADGNLIDVRSIADYIENRPQEDRAARIRRKKA